jgi:YD repeat-containing protein
LSSAELRLAAYEDSDAEVGLRVYGEATAEAQPYSTYSDFMGRSLTSASTTWTTGPWQAGNEYNVDVTNVVAEIMSGGAFEWKNGYPIALQLRAESYSGVLRARSVDDKDGPPARLVLRYGVPVTIRYTYDPLQRLTRADATGATTYTFNYAYDAVGNRTAQTQTITSTLVTTYTYDAANRMTQRSVSDGRVYTYTWSNAGQMLAERTQGVATRVFTYTAAGQLAETSLFTLTTRFTYNGDGARRVVNVIGRGATTYTLDYATDNRILAEKTITGTTLYLYGHDCLGEYTNAWLYYLPDASGYVRQGTDSQGQVTSAWTFDPDGTVLMGPQGLVSHLVCGGVYDWSTGLIYRGGRYFDPSLGIWLALTPLVVMQSWRGRGRKKRRGYTWYLVVVCVVAIGGMLVACGEPTPTPGTPTPTCTDTRTPPWTRIPNWTPTPGWTPTPSRTPTRTPTPTPTPTGCCRKNFGPEPTPSAFPTTEAYLQAQAQYARDRTNAYTQDERLVARMLWWEEKGRPREAMVAVAWNVVNRLNDDTYFSGLDTIQAVLEDKSCHGVVPTQGCIQYQGYWRGDPLPHVDAVWQGNADRRDWFMALDVGCCVLNHCPDTAGEINSDQTRGFLWWGNGQDTWNSMRAKKARDPAFEFFLIPKSDDLWFSNKP